MTECANSVAKILIEIGAIKINLKQPFSYASGLVGPIYCDNRLIWSYIQERHFVMNSFLDLIRKSNLQDKKKLNIKVLALATGGIPHGMLVADKLNLPFGYIRSKAKGHGKDNLIEGNVVHGDEVILIEDLVNQASSLEKALIHLKTKKINYSKCFCLVSYDSLNSKEIEKKYNIKIIPLLSFSKLIAYLSDSQLFSTSEISSLKAWQKNPEEWHK